MLCQTYPSRQAEVESCKHLCLLLIEPKECCQIHYVMRGAHFPHRPRSTADNDALASNRPTQCCIAPALHIILRHAKAVVSQ